MRTTNTILLLFIGINFIACQKGPMAQIESGDWNKERNILNISFKGQIGSPLITREGDNATIKFTYNTLVSSLSSVEIEDMEVSYLATSSVKQGDALNFDNENNTAIITVTPVHGAPLSWNIKLIPFKESLVGKWAIKGLYVFGGTGPEYGGGAISKMTDKPWCWSSTNGPTAEEDNILTFTLDGITPDGNTNGTILNSSGNDGIYADFIFVNATPHIDVNHYYRVLPKGKGKWSRNYQTGRLTITFPDGRTHSCSIEEPGSYDQGWGIVRAHSTPSLAFTLSGTDDWNNIYTDLDRFVKRPRKYWIDIEKP